jgi:hypothetical protein
MSRPVGILSTKKRESEVLEDLLDLGGKRGDDGGDDVAH